MRVQIHVRISLTYIPHTRESRLLNARVKHPLRFLEMSHINRRYRNPRAHLNLIRVTRRVLFGVNLNVLIDVYYYFFLIHSEEKCVRRLRSNPITCS